VKIGYARVSTKRQCESLDQQIKLLKESGCHEVYSEVISGANNKRPELTKVLGALKSNDTLIIASIDRLGRSLKDLISIVNHLQENSVNFYSLKEKMDTSTDSGMLMFNMMGSIAEFERKLINRRIYDGVSNAQELGKYKGRTYSVDEDIRKEYVQMMQSGKYTVAYLAKMAKVSRQTLYNWKIDLQKISQSPL
jgi:DNA invertase Pin-like site-specific DNA recombinase